MAQNTHRIALGIRMTTETGIQIQFCSASMSAASFCIRPVRGAMIARHHHALTMAIDTKRLFLVAGVAVVLIAPGLQRMIIHKVQRVHLAIQVIAVMAIHTIIFGVTDFAFVFIGLNRDPVLALPCQLVIRRF